MLFVSVFVAVNDVLTQNFCPLWHGTAQHCTACCKVEPITLVAVDNSAAIVPLVQREEMGWLCFPREEIGGRYVGPLLRVYLHRVARIVVLSSCVTLPSSHK